MSLVLSPTVQDLPDIFLPNFRVAPCNHLFQEVFISIPESVAQVCQESAKSYFRNLKAACDLNINGSLLDFYNSRIDKVEKLCFDSDCIQSLETSTLQLDSACNGTIIQEGVAITFKNHDKRMGLRDTLVIQDFTLQSMDRDVSCAVRSNEDEVYSARRN